MSVKKGLLLINLGSPESPATRDVRKYLKEFLTDRFVIDIAAPLRYALVHGIIAPLRAPKSAAAYRSVWTENGSPLTHFTRTFAAQVRAHMGESWQVRWAMRYGKPSLKHELRDWQVDQLFIVPLYPQYAESSTRSATEAALEVVRRLRVAKEISVLPDFFAAPEFIETQGAQIAQAVEAFRPDRLLLSFHGLPEHHLSKLHPTYCRFNDQCCAEVTAQNRHCYRAQAFATARALRAQVPLAPEKILVTFQSRLGRRPWIKPYTDLVVTDLVAQGVKRLLVSCPSFVADCLETLEEIEIRLREQFLSLGGEDLRLVPALNASPAWVTAFAKMVERPDIGWVPANGQNV